MIEILDPRKIKKERRPLWDERGWSYMLDYNWIANKAICHGGTNILDVGAGGSPLGPYIANILGAGYTAIDRKRGQDFKDYEPVKPPDVIMWASSLEHNTPREMYLLYKRSMDMLSPGGLFLATVTVAPQTGWFEPSQNTNLSRIDIITMFDEIMLLGDYNLIWASYRDDIIIKERYKARYGHWTGDDPLFLIAGVERVK